MPCDLAVFSRFAPALRGAIEGASEGAGTAMGLTAIDILVLLGVGAAAVLGFMRGFVTEVLSLMAWLLVVAAIRFLHTPVAAALAELGLRGLSWRPVRQLSQGQKRRAALARLMLTPATLWVLDEPFVALDTAAVATLASLVSSHLARGGLAIYTSHQKVEIAAANEQVLELAA